MGAFTCPLRLESLDGERNLEFEALVDTGSFFTFVPAPALEQLKVLRTDSVELEMADGRIVQYDLGHVWASVNGKRVVTLVAFGDAGADALLGVYTLEGLRLAADPVNHLLVPVEVLPLKPNSVCGSAAAAGYDRRWGIAGGGVPHDEGGGCAQQQSAHHYGDPGPAQCARRLGLHRARTPLPR